MRKTLLLLSILLVSVIAGAQTTIFSENFDGLTAGQTVNSQQALFFPWTGQAAENGYVSDAQSHSPSNAMKIINDNDMVFNFGDKTSGEYDVNFWIYIVSTKGGYFNIEHNFGSSWAFAFYFRTDGTCDLIQGGQTTNFAYTMDTWIQVELNINLETDLATAWIDGSEIASWTFSNEEGAAGGVNKLDVINFYGLHQTSTGVNASEYFVDDFEYIEIQSGLTPPTIDFETTEISTFGTDDELLGFSNLGEEVMNYSAYPVYEDPSLSSDLVDGQMNYDLDIITAIGWAESFEVDVAVRMGNDLTSQHLGQEIKYISFFINDLPASETVTVYVWAKGGYTQPGTSTVLFEQEMTPTAQTWNAVTLETPIVITGEELWIGYHFTGPAGLFTLGVDDQPVVPGTCYLRTGPVWSEFTGIEGTGNFCIRAEVEGLGWPAWLVVTPESGTLAAGDDANLTLSFNTDALTAGTYYANVVVGANDPDQQWTEIPVTLDFGVGIENENLIGVMTYPNPAKDFVNIVSDNEINSIAIYNIVGQLVAYSEVNANRSTLDISKLSAGEYIIEVKVAGNTSRSKLVID